MANNKTLYFVIVVLILLIIGIGLFFFLNKKGGNEIPAPATENTQKEAPASSVNVQENAQTSTSEEKMVDCGTAENPSCFMGRANSCLPVKVKMVGSDNKTEIELTILGVENDKCHFQRKLNGVLNLNCYFPKGTNMMNAIDQTFGNDHGLQKVVDDACAGW